MQALIAQVERMVAESSDPTGFDAKKWLANWLEQPCPALGNQLPGDVIKTAEGEKIVSALLRQMQSGAYA